MLPKILIIIGLIFFSFGLIGLISISLQPILKAMRVLFKQDRDDFLYEHGKGQKVLEESRKLLKKSCIFFTFLGLFLAVSGLIMQYMPIGNDSIFSSKVEGSDVGDDKQPNMSYNDDTSSMSADYYIVISGDIVSLNEETFDTIEDFEEILTTLERINPDGSKKAAVIIDDYAISPIYHHVEKLIDKCGLELIRQGDAE